jgi:hypothetical protein
MFCPQCGSQRPDTDNFCAVCGAQLRADSVTRVPQGNSNTPTFYTTRLTEVEFAGLVPMGPSTCRVERQAIALSYDEGKLERILYRDIQGVSTRVQKAFLSPTRYIVEIDGITDESTRTLYCRTEDDAQRLSTEIGTAWERWSS